MKNLILIIICSLAMANVHSQTLTAKKNAGLWGFVNETDSFVIAPKYTAVGEFLSDYTWVNIGGKTQYELCPQGGKWGVIDKKGNEVCPVKYDYVDLCANNRVAVNIGGKMKNMIIEGGKWGFVDLTNGQEVVPPQYDQVGAFANNNVAWVENGGSLHRKVWDIEEKDTKGKVSYRERLFNVFDNFSIQEIFQDYNTSGLWALIDLSGNEIVGFQFTKAGDFCFDVAWAVQNEKYGMIDYTGKICVPFQYAKLSNCYDNDVIWAWEKDNGSSSKIGLITKTGTPLTEMKYSEIQHFTDGVAWAKVNDLYVLVNHDGKELTKPRYSKVGDFYNNVAMVWSESDAIGLVNKNGKEIARTMYGSAAEHFGVCQFRTDKNKNGEIISWISHPQLGSNWINQDGKVIVRGSKVVFKLTDVIPEPLWDY